MHNYSVRFDHNELIFLNKVLDHYRLFIRKHFGETGKFDHSSIKKKIIEGVYKSNDYTVDFTIRELKFLRNILFQHFIGSLKTNLIKEELPFLSIYFVISDLIDEPVSDVLQKLRDI
jgi:hypothetical protein